ncbi:hypothetical protein Lal_00028107 [Lupinus albus]|nr:hypothetical protein Lal_00028107 [Lupinus albus]
MIFNIIHFVICSILAFIVFVEANPKENNSKIKHSLCATMTFDQKNSERSPHSTEIFHKRYWADSPNF